MTASEHLRPASPATSFRLPLILIPALLALLSTALSAQQLASPTAPSPGVATQPLGSLTPETPAPRRSIPPGAEQTPRTVPVAAPEPAPQPDPPTPFQRLVAQTTGTPLPLFGASLFANVPSTFAPVDNVPVASNYLLGPGDEIRVQLYGQVNQQGSFTIDRTGDISFPEVGTIHLAGLPYSQLQPFLRAQLARIYRNFELNVSLGQLRSMQVFVVGQARRPGTYTISSLSSLLNALFASGGPTPQGSLRDIQVARQGAVLTHFDLYALLLHGDKTHDISLMPGDTLFIPIAGPQIAITGSVNVPAIYEVTPGTTVTQALALAGGTSSLALGSQVRLERVFEHTMRSVVDVSLAQHQDPLVQDGDILSVAAIQDRFKDAVTLRGNVASPGRYVWRPGMRIADLVPSTSALITRDFDRRLNALGNISTPAPDAARLQPQSTGTQPPATTSPGGNSIGAALTRTDTLFASTNDVVLSAPDIDWSYAVVERLDPVTLKTQLLEFNPGRLFLERDPSQNLPLQPGDVVTFFSTADIRVPAAQQTRFIRLEGEFRSPGVYSVQPGDTLRTLVARAGGLTGHAFLFASEFTRQSARRIQQQRLNEYADSLESRLSLESSTNSSKAISSQDVAAASAAQVTGQQIVDRLRRTTALGRIVLEVKPESAGLDSIPEIALEDGDRFLVPRTPATVSVEGQVYSANSFLFIPGHRSADYLHQAGGPDRDADRKRIFLLRADGSVLSDQYGNVARAVVYPGDTIVVPPRLQHPSLFRDLVDASAIAGQVGILAAVLATH